MLRQKSYDYTVSTGIEFEPAARNETAGLVLYQNHENHLSIEIARQAGNSGECVLRVTEHVKGAKKIISEYPVISHDLIEIQLRASKQKAKVWIAENGKLDLVQDKIDLIPYTTEEAGGFVGCTIGMYATSNGVAAQNVNYADFLWFNYDNQ